MGEKTVTQFQSDGTVVAVSTIATDAQADNFEAIRLRLLGAIASNKQFLSDVAAFAGPPTAAQAEVMVAHLPAVVRQLNGLIRLLVAYDFSSSADA